MHLTVLCCLLNAIQVKEYDAHIEEVGKIGNSYQEYVIDIVIESQ